MLPYALSLLAGAVLPLAFAPFEQFWIAPLSYAVLLYLWTDVPSGRGFGLGFVYGCASFGGGTYWTYIAVRDMGGAPIAVAVFLTVGLTLVCAAFVGAAGFIAARWFETSGAAAWLVTLPALFVLCEWTRGWMFTGFGWLSAGYSQTRLVAHGLRAAARAARDELGRARDGRRARDASRSATRCGERARRRGGSRRGAGPGGSGARAVTVDEPKERALTVALLQGAITQDLKWKPEQLTGTLALYARSHAGRTSARISSSGPRPRCRRSSSTCGQYVDGLRRARDSAAAPCCSASCAPPGRRASETFQNVVVALTEPAQTYVKRHLVPFGEYFPVPPFIRTGCGS